MIEFLNWVCVSVFVSLFSVQSIEDGSIQKASTILAGIQSKRESIPVCRFSIEETVVTVDSKGKKDTLPSKWEVILTTNEVLFRKDDGSAASILRQNEIVHSSLESVVVQGIASGSAAYAFDPRLLGISIGPFENSRLSRALRSNDRSNVETETVQENGNTVQKVSVTDRNGERLIFWVEPEKEFRVNKFEYLSPKIMHEVTSSEYSDSFCKGLLPTRLVTVGENLVAGASFNCTRNLSSYAEIPPKKLGFADMGLAVGIPYSDIRVHKRIGYWDGDKIVSDAVRMRGAPRISAQAAKEASGWSIGWILVGIAACIGLIFGVRKAWK